MLIGYARVSTVDQNTSLQVQALNSAGCECIYEEQASGAQRDRPQLAEALTFLRKGDTLVVWKLDRLARSVRQLIDTVEMLASRGIGFRSLTEQIDTTSAAGRLIFHIFGALAEFERSLIRERTVAGLAAARANGKIGGRPRLMTDDKISAVRALLALPDVTVASVAKQLGVSVPTIYRHLPSAKSESHYSSATGVPKLVEPIVIDVAPTHGRHARK